MNKDINYYMNLPYTIEMISDPDGGWVASVKELPGCMSQGDTPEETIEMIRDAMQGWLEVALEDGDTIPEPRRLKDFSGKFVVRVPRSMHRDLVERSDEEGVSLNQYINTALARALGSVASPPMKPAEDPPGWPGLKAGVRQALIAAGMGEEAGTLEEKLLADHLENLLAQVDSALQSHCYQEAQLYLKNIEATLHLAATRSPVLGILCHMISLMQRQVAVNIEQLYAPKEELLLSRISQMVERTTAAVVQQATREAEAQYSYASREPMPRAVPRTLFEKMTGW